MVKTYGINAKEALIGDWEEVNKETNPCDVCSKITSRFAWLPRSIDFLIMVLQINVLWYFLQERYIPTKIPLGWNEVSGCHTKPK